MLSLCIRLLPPSTPFTSRSVLRPFTSLLLYTRLRNHLLRFFVVLFSSICMWCASGCLSYSPHHLLLSVCIHYIIHPTCSTHVWSTPLTEIVLLYFAWTVCTLSVYKTSCLPLHTQSFCIIPFTTKLALDMSEAPVAEIIVLLSHLIHLHLLGLRQTVYNSSPFNSDSVFRAAQVWT